MEFNAKNVDPVAHKTACLVLGVLESRGLTPAGERVDAATGGMLCNLLRDGDHDGTLGQTLLLHNVPGIAAERVLLVGCGKSREFDAMRYQKMVASTFTSLDRTGARDVAVFLADLDVPDRDLYWKVRQVVEGGRYALYRFDRLKGKNGKKRSRLRRAMVNVPDQAELPGARDAIREGNAIAEGVRLARDLGNLPPNICTPAYLAREARALAKDSKTVKVRVLDQGEMKKLGMGALLSVAQGSREPAKLITIEYQGGKANEKPVALVGKGVTFDSGGISIKPAAKMDEMKFDMAGAASVIGTLSAVAGIGLPVNVVGVIPATENLPDGNASKPGNVVTTMSGRMSSLMLRP